MARIFTKPESETAAKVLMHNITVAGGINTNNLQKGRLGAITNSNFMSASQAICTELVNRDFTDIDRAINIVSNYEFIPNYDGRGREVRFVPEKVAKAIVYMAELLNLYWDDTIRTPYEVEEFKKTLLGNAVYRYGRYISALKDPAKPKASKATADPNAPKVAATAKNDFRQQGPKSSQARGLVNLDGTPVQPGQPGEKVFIDKGYALAIRGTVAGKASEVRAVVTPLNAKGAVGSKNKVFINASHGYGVAECLFDDMDDAVNFYDQLVLNNRIPSDVTNLQIGQIKVDKNGYFLVDTEFGICAIAARVLNEDIDADSKDCVEEDLGECWKKATEGYSQEQLDDLHSWMRKD